MKAAKNLITTLDLQPHPEGGWFRETYRAPEVISSPALPDRFAASRNFSTAIYFLLTADTFSAFHRLKSDEMWHFYSGSTLIVHVLSPEGAYTPIRLGSQLEAGDRFQCVVPRGCWFAASLAVPDTYALVGCTVTPGFDFADFEMADRKELLSRYPQHWELIRRLTRD